MPRLYFLREGHSSSSSIQSICSLYRSLADLGILRIGKNLSEYPFSLRFSLRVDINIYLLENFNAFSMGRSLFYMLQLDRGREFYRYSEFLEHGNV